MFNWIKLLFQNSLNIPDHVRKTWKEDITQDIESLKDVIDKFLSPPVMEKGEKISVKLVLGTSNTFSEKEKEKKISHKMCVTT